MGNPEKRVGPSRCSGGLTVKRRLPILAFLFFASLAPTALGVLPGARESAGPMVVSASQAVRTKGPSPDQVRPQVPTQGGSAAKLTEGAKK
jgi:hypothetical protein